MASECQLQLCIRPGRIWSLIGESGTFDQVLVYVCDAVSSSAQTVYCKELRFGVRDDGRAELLACDPWLSVSTPPTISIDILIYLKCSDR
jgi:hypothetical protein